jgi:hypothetical protein
VHEHELKSPWRFTFDHWSRSLLLTPILDTRSVELLLGLLTPEPPPSSAPRIGECEEHVFSHLLITRHPLEVELKCCLARRKHRYESRGHLMNDVWRGPDV